MEWVPIKGYENYFINEKAEIKSLYSDKILKHTKNIITGYDQVNLWKDKKQKTLRVHRLVAETFLNKPSEEYEVNHIDGVKTNNELSNLEWLTRSDNLKHAYKNELHDKNKLINRGIKAGEGAIKKLGKKIKLNSPDGSVLEFDSIRQACRELNLDNKHLSMALRDTHKNRKVKGYTINRC